VNLETFPITSWNEDSVVFTNSAPTCVHYIYTINPRIKSVTGVRKRLPPEQQRGECIELADELRLTMKDGIEISGKMQADAQPWYSDIVYAPLKWIFGFLD